MKIFTLNKKRKKKEQSLSTRLKSAKKLLILVSLITRVKMRFFIYLFSVIIFYSFQFKVYIFVQNEALIGGRGV